jgi:hypothetical protein
VRVVANTTGYNGTSHILHGYVGCPEPMNENALEGGTPCDRVLAETDGTGPAGTKREYIWLGDMPVAVIDKSVTPNKTYMVHADHLNRPYFMTDATKARSGRRPTNPSARSTPPPAPPPRPIASLASGSRSKAGWHTTGTATTMPRSGGM